MVSLNGVNTGPSQEGLTGPPLVEEEEDPAAAAAEAVDRGEEDEAAFEDKVPLGLPMGGTSVNLTDQGGFWDMRGTERCWYQNRSSIQVDQPTGGGKVESMLRGGCARGGNKTKEDVVHHKRTSLLHKHKETHNQSP